MPGSPATSGTVEGGYLAATVGGSFGAACGAWVGWLLVPLIEMEGDPSLGPANLAVGLVLLLIMVGGGMTVGALAGIGVALRVAGHRGIALTMVVAASLAGVLGALLVYLSAPPVVAVPLLVGIVAVARWLVIQAVRRRNKAADARRAPRSSSTD